MNTARPDGTAQREGGAVVIEWVLAICVLLVPMLGLFSFPAWVERQNMARLGAHEAARAVAVATDTDAGIARGNQVVTEIARNHGVDPATVSVAYEGDTNPGSSVTATVTVQMPALKLPGMGTLGSVDYSTSHRELVDLYRSVPG